MITIRPATLQDAIHLYVWRTHPSTRQMMRETEDFSWEAHLRWLRDTLEDTSKVLLMGMRGGQPVGTARLDITGTDAEISVTVAPECRGTGIGSELICEATIRVMFCRSLQRVIARVKPENIASLKAFTKAGYQETSRTNEEVTLIVETKV